MALKNTYSKSPVHLSLLAIEHDLVKAGASGVYKGYEDGRIVSMSFSILLKGNMINFKLPIGWKKVQQVLKNEEAKNAGDDDYAYRIAWAIMRDWISAQMAILASETVTIPQLFLPYAVAKNGQTLFEEVIKSGILLIDSK